MSSTQKNDPTILVFDSGVGGLSIYQEVQRLVPFARYVYASDNEAFPYGTKREEEVIARVSDVLHRLISRFAPDVLVVACNTASTVALPKLRSHIPIPLVGVVPAIKPAARVSKSRVIGLLATPGTVQRSYTRNLIDEFAQDCTVVRVGSSELVELAEDKLRGTTLDIERIRGIIAPLFAGEYGSKLDTVVLGCTHFPLLKTELTAASPWPVAWVDSGLAIAKRVRFLLKGKFPYFGSEEQCHHDRENLQQAAFTRDGPDVPSLEPALRRLGFSRIVFL
jgi:glutamate racemase